jgi:hypothetical protein
MLKKDEIEELVYLGKSLEYIESIDLYIEQLEYRIRNVRESYCAKKKLCRSLGITGGIFIVIILI